MLRLLDLSDFALAHERKFCFDGLRDGEGERLRSSKLQHAHAPFERLHARLAPVARDRLSKLYQMPLDRLDRHLFQFTAHVDDFFHGVAEFLL